MSSEARNMLQELINKALVEHGDVLKVKNIKTGEWMSIHSAEMVSGHEFHITAIDSDGIAVRNSVFMGLDGDCDCGKEIALRVKRENGEEFEANEPLRKLLDGATDQVIANIRAKNLETVIRITNELRDDIKRAESDGYETDTLYKLCSNQPGHDRYFYCTKVMTCEDTGLQELGGFMVDDEGVTPNRILSIHIDKKVEEK